MRLDATTTEVVSFLRDQGFSVNFPIDANLGDDTARVALKGGHYANVTRDDTGSLRAAVECNTPPVERLSYHDLLVVYTELDKRYDAIQALWAVVCDEPAFAAAAREYTNTARNVCHILHKIGRILKAERAEQYRAEMEEIANRC